MNTLEIIYQNLKTISKTDLYLIQGHTGRNEDAKRQSCENVCHLAVEENGLENKVKRTIWFTQAHKEHAHAHLRHQATADRV